MNSQISLIKFPELAKIVEYIFSNSPLQKKRISKYFAGQTSPEFWQFSEDLSAILNAHFMPDPIGKEKAANAYNKMCMDFLSEQIKFKRTGKYSCIDSAVANSAVYGDPKVMRYYMIGLLLSYIFWPNHYELFRFFKHSIPRHNINNYLEVGVGHGLFTSTILQKFPLALPTIVDISATSIETAKEILQCFSIRSTEFNFIHNDFLKTEFAHEFEFIIMGEVLEHVNDASLFMKKTKSLLASKGSVYLSTCANSSALDHVYHFHNVDEIRDLILSSGFQIVKDLALPAEDIPQVNWERELVTINYCALLEHQ